MRVRVTPAKRNFAKSLRGNSTEAEAELWRVLRSRRLAEMKFRRQVPIGNWIVDFVSFQHRLIVEADGSQHADNERDTMREQDLTEWGFRVLRFWNNDIMAKQSAVVEAIFASTNLSPSPDALRAPPSPTTRCKSIARGEGKEEKNLNV